MRATSRNRAEEHDTFASIVGRLRHEFLGTPALALTPANAARLWGLDRTTAVCVLDFLAARGYLQKVANGIYTRCHGWDQLGA
jgi:predicted transcriptional regulator of viral defense system